VLKQDYHQQVEKGKNRVEETVRCFGSEMSIPIEYMEWRLGEGNFKQNRLSLIIIVKESVR